jgi:sugar/nucleoside kinase (ribokinase family)
VTTASPTVLVAGAASRDITSLDPRGWRLGGAVTYASLALARFGLEVRAVIGVDGAAARADELALLRDAGVELSLASLGSGPVFQNIDHPEGRRQRCVAASDPLSVAAIPPAWREGADAVLLVPVAGEIDDAWVRASGGRRLGIGWQGFLRDVRAGRDVAPRLPAGSPLLSAATLVVASREDVAPGTNPETLMSLLAPGATFVLTEGDAGGLVLRHGPAADVLARRYPAIPSDGTVDATGAGDVFLAAMLATLLQPSLAAGLPDWTTFAAAAGSLAVEAPGLLGVPDLAATGRRATRAASRARRRPSAASRRGIGRPSQA